MGPYKMIVGAPPLEMSQELWGLLGRGPGSTCQRSHAVTDGQIHPFNKSGIQPSREAHSLQGGLEGGFCPQAHDVRDPNQLAPLVAFFHLAIDQVRRHLPPVHVAPSASLLPPCPKMSCQSIEVHV